MKTNLQMIYDILKDDYKVTLLKSGAQLIKYLEKNPYPDLILLDIDMPQMDGIEAAKAGHGYDKGECADHVCICTL